MEAAPQRESCAQLGCLLGQKGYASILGFHAIIREDTYNPAKQYNISEDNYPGKRRMFDDFIKS